MGTSYSSLKLTYCGVAIFTGELTTKLDPDDPSYLGPLSFGGKYVVSGVGLTTMGGLPVYPGLSKSYPEVTGLLFAICRAAATISHVLSS